MNHAHPAWEIAAKQFSCFHYSAYNENKNISSQDQQLFDVHIDTWFARGLQNSVIFNVSSQDYSKASNRNVVRNNENEMVHDIGQGEAQHRKCVRPK